MTIFLSTNTVIKAVLIILSRDCIAIFLILCYSLSMQLVIKEVFPLFTYDDIISSKFLQNSFYDINNDSEMLCLEYLPTDFNNTVEVKKIFEGEVYSLLLNLFELDTTCNEVSFYDLKNLLFIEKDTDEINELDLDVIDFNITNTKVFIDEYLNEYTRLATAYPIINIIFSKIWTILRYLVCKDKVYDGIYKIDFKSQLLPTQSFTTT